MVETNRDQKTFLEHYLKSSVHCKVLAELSRKYPFIYSLAISLLLPFPWLNSFSHREALTEFLLYSRHKHRKTQLHLRWITLHMFVEHWLRVSVCSGCCDWHHRLGAYKQQTLISHEAGSLRPSADRFGVWWRPSSWLQTANWSVSSHSGRDKGAFYGLFNEGTNSTCGGSTFTNPGGLCLIFNLILSVFSKKVECLPNTNTLGVWISRCECWGHIFSL